MKFLYLFDFSFELLFVHLVLFMQLFASLGLLCNLFVVVLLDVLYFFELFLF
jgi:hypothetical protein